MQGGTAYPRRWDGQQKVNLCEGSVMGTIRPIGVVALAVALLVASPVATAPAQVGGGKAVEKWEYGEIQYTVRRASGFGQKGQPGKGGPPGGKAVQPGQPGQGGKGKGGQPAEMPPAGIAPRNLARWVTGDDEI